MKTKLYTVKGEVKNEVSLPTDYDLKSSSAILKQAIRVLEDNTHFGLSKVKTRSEVNMTKKKLYKQKGTGGARHGAKSAHIFVGGGVVHGPTGEKRDLSLPTKMKKVALRLALSKVFKSGKAVLVENLGKVNKTSEANKIVESVLKSLNLKNKVVVVLANDNIKSAKIYRNIKNVTVKNFSSLNALVVLTANVLLIDSACFEVKATAEKKTVKKVVKKLEK